MAVGAISSNFSTICVFCSRWCMLTPCLFTTRNAIGVMETPPPLPPPNGNDEDDDDEESSSLLLESLLWLLDENSLPPIANPKPTFDTVKMTPPSGVSTG